MSLKLRIISIALCLTMLFASFAMSILAHATEIEALNKKGIVITESDNLNIRSGPGTKYAKAGSVAKDSVVNVLSSTVNELDEKWYKITYSEITGYVMAKYIRLIEIPQISDETFEEALLQFPESYHEKLRTLHALHPTWKFTALKTNITWETLTKNQYITGRNMVQSPTAWKSFEKGAYDWENESWYVFDSGGWVQTCREVIDYYLDPRNFLDGNIYQFLVLSDDGSEVDADVINGILKNTFMHSKSIADDMTYAQGIVKAAKEVGASPYMLAARIRMEQGAIGNKLAHGTVAGYEGYYNHFDIGAYAHDGRSAMVNGAIYAKNKGWNTPYKAILGGATFLVKNYISVGQNTLYLQKYDVVDGGNGFYAHQYMTNVSAAASECESLRSAISGTAAEESPLNFLIPVYEDMPETPGKLPLTTGNANNLLESLSVKEGAFKVAFDMYTQQYELFVETDKITVSATPKDEKATVSGTGEIKLTESITEVPVTVTATNGLKRTYKIFVTTTADLPDSTPSPTPEGTPEGTPDTVTPSPSPTPIPKEFNINYEVADNMIYGVKPQTSFADFKVQIASKGYTVRYTDIKGTEKAVDDIMKTGDFVYVDFEGTNEKTLQVVILGDVNCDGKLSVADLIVAQKHTLKIATLTDTAKIKAVDMNRDGKTNVADLILNQKRMLGLV